MCLENPYSFHLWESAAWEGAVLSSLILKDTEVSGLFQLLTGLERGGGYVKWVTLQMQRICLSVCSFATRLKAEWGFLTSFGNKAGFTKTYLNSCKVCADFYLWLWLQVSCLGKISEISNKLCIKFQAPNGVNARQMYKMSLSCFISRVNRAKRGQLWYSENEQASSRQRS